MGLLGEIAGGIAGYNASDNHKYLGALAGMGVGGGIGILGARALAGRYGTTSGLREMMIDARKRGDLIRREMGGKRGNALGRFTNFMSRPYVQPMRPRSGGW